MINISRPTIWSISFRRESINLHKKIFADGLKNGMSLSLRTVIGAKTSSTEVKKKGGGDK